MDQINLKIKEYVERCRKDPRTTEDLFAEAAAATAYKNSDDEVLSGLYWEPVRILHCRADNMVMAASSKLLASTEGSDRALAADILAQVSVGDQAKQPEAADLLFPAFQRETDIEALNSMAFAYGHFKDERTIPRLVDLSRHPDENLRYAVVSGLSGSDDVRAIAALITLSSDSDSDVRDWATFGLGTLTDVDTPQLRHALAARLNDIDEATRQEALVGLARRSDLRVIPALLKELEFCSPETLEEFWWLQDAAKEAIRSATKVPDTKWCPLLKKLKSLGMGDPTEIQSALMACQHLT